jgi:hypothetical protein
VIWKVSPLCLVAVTVAVPDLAARKEIEDVPCSLATSGGDIAVSTDGGLGSVKPQSVPVSVSVTGSPDFTVIVLPLSASRSVTVVVDVDPAGGVLASAGPVPVVVTGLEVDVDPGGTEPVVPAV